MENSELKPNDPARDSGITHDTGIDHSEKKATYRRLQDVATLKYPNRKMNLDRRVTPVDRRVYTDLHYKGPARRISIDARNSIDRRDQSRPSFC